MKNLKFVAGLGLVVVVAIAAMFLIENSHSKKISRCKELKASLEVVVENLNLNEDEILSLLESKDFSENAVNSGLLCHVMVKDKPSYKMAMGEIKTIPQLAMEACMAN
jgi:ABC-type metal ion transport system substrate-binding protein